jgi:A/G-specific adenine glycosylase
MSLKKTDFAPRLLRWNQKSNHRAMPWKGEKDPYKIWISEVILQQTRVEQGVTYYNNIIKKFPTLDDLANASDPAVFKIWEGLGYYSRCRNMLETARYLAREQNGQFPKTYEAVLSLKGIGPYTAAALVSFAYNLPYAVVDGNVVRVLSRVFGLSNDFNSTKGKAFFQQFAQQLLPEKKAGAYNQSIMDFGATVCKPVNPQCDRCVFQDGCHAFLHQQIAAFPVKKKKQPLKKRSLIYLVFNYRGHSLVRKRIHQDIWRHLHEFVLLPEENALITDPVELTQLIADNYPDLSFRINNIAGPFRQVLSHQVIQAIFIEVGVRKKPKIDGYQLVSAASLRQLAFPVLIRSYREKHAT